MQYLFDVLAHKLPPGPQWLREEESKMGALYIPFIESPLVSIEYGFLVQRNSALATISKS
jgi:hypothetical protein